MSKVPTIPQLPPAEATVVTTEVVVTEVAVDDDLGAATTDSFTSFWATFEPQVERLAPAAAHAAGQALLDSWRIPSVGDPAVFDRTYETAINAGASVASDPKVASADRATASGHLCRMIEVGARVQEQAEARRERWWRDVGRALVPVFGLALVVKALVAKDFRAKKRT